MSETSLGRMVLDASERHGGAAIRFPRDGTWHEWTFEHLGTAVSELARGLVAYGSEEIRRIARRPAREIAEVLGYSNGDEVIHRDDLVLVEGPPE